jgi:RNA polymerase sigma-70 factor, ECF subfamily
VTVIELLDRWTSPAAAHAVRPSLAELYAAHADFAWRCLQRLGVPAADLQDALQEVFVAAHSKLRDFDPNRALATTWLFGICSNVARNVRRRVRRHARPFEFDAQDGRSSNPEEELQRARARSRLLAILEDLSPPLRATFVMFEIEGKSCAEISELTGAPLGTVHSRLHKARSRFRALLEKQRHRESLLLRSKHHE